MPGGADAGADDDEAAGHMGGQTTYRIAPACSDLSNVLLDLAQVGDLINRIASSLRSRPTLPGYSAMYCSTILAIDVLKPSEIVVWSSSRKKSCSSRRSPSSAVAGHLRLE